jgi:chaperonin GroEL (HSP60 family)
MTAKQIKYSDDARRSIFNGISKVAQAVMVTMGPK